MRFTRTFTSLAAAGVALAGVSGAGPAVATTEPPGGGETPSAPVALIIAQGGLGDAAYNDLAYSGLQRGAEELGIEAQPGSG